MKEIDLDEHFQKDITYLLFLKTFVNQIEETLSDVHIEQLIENTFENKKINIFKGYFIFS